MNAIKVIILSVIAAIILAVLAFSLELGGLSWAKYFGPKRAAIRREIFKETKSYNEAKMQDLLKYRMEYMNAEDDEKETLAFTIRHMFADYDESKLPEELADFLKEIKYGD